MPVKGNRSVPKELEGRGTGAGRLSKGFGSKPDGAACCDTCKFPERLGSGNWNYVSRNGNVLESAFLEQSMSSADEECQCHLENYEESVCLIWHVDRTNPSPAPFINCRWACKLTVEWSHPVPFTRLQKILGKKKIPTNVKANLWSFCNVVVWQKATKEVKMKVRM